MKKIILILFIFILTGCDYVEINDLGIITGMIIDYKDDSYLLTSKMINSDNTVIVYKTLGKTIDECIYKISKQSNKKVFLSHLKTLIITENLIKSNKPYYDYFLRDPRIKMNFDIYYIDNNFIEEIFNINKDKFYIKDMMELNNKEYSSSYKLSFLDLIYKKEYKLDILYPNIIIDNNTIYLQNLVGFNSNYEKIILNDKESIIYNILTNNLNKTDIVFPCNDNNFSITINKAKTKVSKKSTNIKITGKMNSYDCVYNLNKADTMNKLSNIVNKEIKKNVNNLLTKLKNNNMNIFDINKNVKVKTAITSIGELRK